MMRLLLNHGTDAAFNLALEEVLTRDEPEELLMLWRNASAVIVGRNQNTAAEINGDFIRTHRIQVVRRMTGGGAVYHDSGNFNYTIILNRKALAPERFAEFAAPVVSALNALGAPAEFSGRNDIVVKGRKVSGSAQNCTGNRTLFHGTLLFNTDLSVLEKALRPDPRKLIDKGVRSVRARVLNLCEVLPEIPDAEHFQDRFIATLTATGQFSAPEAVPEAHCQAAEALAEMKYRTHDWNYGARHDYRYRHSRHFPGGTVEIALQIENNRIAAAQFSGDFFGDRPASELAAQLTGFAPEREALAAILTPERVAPYFYRIAAEELLTLFE